MVLEVETGRWMQDEDREVIKTWKDKTPCRRGFDCFFSAEKGKGTSDCTDEAQIVVGDRMCFTKCILLKAIDNFSLGSGDTFLKIPQSRLSRL